MITRRHVPSRSVSEAILSQVRHNLTEQPGNGRHIKNIVATGIGLCIDLLEQFIEPPVREPFLEISFQIVDTLRQPLPDRPIGIAR